MTSLKNDTGNQQHPDRHHPKRHHQRTRSVKNASWQRTSGAPHNEFQVAGHDRSRLFVALDDVQIREDEGDEAGKVLALYPRKNVSGAAVRTTARQVDSVAPRKMHSRSSEHVTQQCRSAFAGHRAYSASEDFRASHQLEAVRIRRRIRWCNATSLWQCHVHRSTTNDPKSPNRLVACAGTRQDSKQRAERVVVVCVSAYVYVYV